MSTTQIPVTIYAESTPNPASLKFVANRMIVQNGASYNYASASEADSSPLAASLFRFPFVKAVFISANFITLTRKDGIAWEEVTLELRNFLKNYLSEGKQVVNEAEVPEPGMQSQLSSSVQDHVTPATDTEQKIIDVLDEYVRPAVEQDGGLITFKSFRDGIVTVVLRGACSGCPSSTLTLKTGIEGLLKRMVPEVKEVVSEAL